MSDLDTLRREAQNVAKARPSSQLNPSRTNNQYVNFDFPQYEYFEYPKAVKVPLPTVKDPKTGVILPDEDELPVSLQRKIREWEDDHGQIHTSYEADKAWLRRCEKFWPLFYPRANNKAEEEAILKSHSNVKA